MKPFFREVKIILNSIKKWIKTMKYMTKNMYKILHKKITVSQETSLYLEFINSLFMTIFLEKHRLKNFHEIHDFDKNSQL